MVQTSPSGVQEEYPGISGAECPWPLLAHRRAEEPVTPLPGFSNVFILSKYQDIRFVYRRTDLFSSDRVRAEFAGYSMIYEPTADSTTMAECDPPEHTAKRELAAVAVKPGRLRRFEPVIYQLVDELIDSFIHAGHVEFVEQFAIPLPSRLVRQLMDVSDEHEPLIKAWTRSEASGLPWCDEAFKRRQAEDATRMTDLLSRLVAERAAQPGDDLISTVVRAQIDRDGELRLNYVRGQVAILLSGGVRTTAYFLPSMMEMLVRHPKQMAALRAAPRLIPRAIEEGLRLEPPIMWNPRRARRTVQLSGVAIPKGSIVLAMLCSGNRDEMVFDQAAVFDPSRQNVREHLTFGAGKHSCLGAPLARMELRIAFERLLARLGPIRLAGDNDFVHISSASFRGLRRLHLEFDPISS
jgi:cytochrome P450